jgi:hypothetical protein
MKSKCMYMLKQTLEKSVPNFLYFKSSPYMPYTCTPYQALEKYNRSHPDSVFRCSGRLLVFQNVIGRLLVFQNVIGKYSVIPLHFLGIR